MAASGGGGGPVFGGGGASGTGSVSDTWDGVGNQPNGSFSNNTEYAKALGRISGPLLADNLVSFQDGGDLAFDTDLLYLDVANKRIGINNFGTSPTTLYVSGNNNLTTIDFIVDNYYNNNWTISSNNISVTAGTIYVSPAATIVYGPTGSIQFNSASRQWLSLNGSAGTAMGTGDFTWELFVYPTSTPNYQTFIDTRGVQTGYSATDTDGVYLGLNTGTLYPIYLQGTVKIVSTIPVTLNGWTHVALVKRSGTTTLYVGGQVGGTYADSLNLSAQYINIGGTLGDSNLSFNGRISNLRIVKGTAVYTTIFTPPTMALLPIAGTQLLLNTVNGATFLADTSTNNFTLVNHNNATSLTSSPVTGPITDYAGAIVNASGVGTANLNLISSGFNNPATNGSINLTPNGIGNVSWTGKGLVTGNTSLTTITGNAFVTGNLNASGTINFGDNAVADAVTFTADLANDLNPSTTNVDTLGSSSIVWNTLYATTVDAPNITATTLNAGGITVTNNTIYSTNSDNDITFAPTGTGNVKLNSIYPFDGNNVVNSTSLPYNLLSTNDGFWNFNSSTAIIFPIGTTSQRITATLGTTRYNTESQFLEIYNGTNWQNVIGSSPPTTAADANELGIIYDLILG
jgi:hypothetical protein